MSDCCFEWGPATAGPHQGWNHQCALTAGHTGPHQCACRITTPEFVVNPTHHQTERENSTMTNPNDSAIEVLARRRLELTAKRDDIDDSIAQVDAALMTLLQPGEAALIDGQPVWVVTSQNRWSEAKAREVLPDVLIDSCTVTDTHLDAKVAKAQLPPDLYAKCTVSGKPFVRKAGR